MLSVYNFSELNNHAHNAKIRPSLKFILLWYVLKYQVHLKYYSCIYLSVHLPGTLVFVRCFKLIEKKRLHILSNKWSGFNVNKLGCSSFDQICMIIT